MHNRYAKKGNGVSAQLLLFSKNRTSKYKKTKAIITLLHYFNYHAHPIMHYAL